MHQLGPPRISKLSSLTQMDMSAEILADEFGGALRGAKILGFNLRGHVQPLDSTLGQ